jgi:hypothetical protein
VHVCCCCFVAQTAKQKKKKKASIGPDKRKEKRGCSGVALLTLFDYHSFSFSFSFLVVQSQGEKKKSKYAFSEEFLYSLSCLVGGSVRTTFFFHTCFCPDRIDQENNKKRWRREGRERSCTRSSSRLALSWRCATCALDL